jgi:hypothetical protein
MAMRRVQMILCAVVVASSLSLLALRAVQGPHHAGCLIPMNGSSPRCATGFFVPDSWVILTTMLGVVAAVIARYLVSNQARE